MKKGHTSLIFHGPGLKLNSYVFPRNEIRKTRTGSAYARNFPEGCASKMRTRGVTEGAGYRKLKKVLSPAETQHRNKPTVHIRNVDTGMSGSSLFDTLAWTSGNGAGANVMGIKLK